MQLSFAPVVKQASPAVVNIYAKRVVNVRTNPFRSDPFFDNASFAISGRRVSGWKTRSAPA